MDRSVLISTRPFLIPCLILSLSSCSGGGSDGGGEGATPSVAAPAQIIVSGSVQAPAGQIAFFREKSLGELFASEAYAALTGLAPVSDGTLVRLERLDTASLTPITTTTTSSGRYTFNLTALGVNYSDNLVIRVANGSTQMRTFVTGPTVDLDPIAEAVFQIVFEQPGGSILSRFTHQELADLDGTARLLTNLNALSLQSGVAQAVDSIKTSLLGDSSFTAFLASASGAGQTSDGPGDIGNYLPFDLNNTWRYQGQKRVGASTAVAFSNTRRVGGTHLVGSGITAQVLIESNHSNSGTEEYDYFLKTTEGIIYWGNNDNSDLITPRVIPYHDKRFPLHLGRTVDVVNRTGVDLGLDIDGDGQTESLSILIQTTGASIERVIVPAGTFEDCVKLESHASISLTLSASKRTVTSTGELTEWLAPRVGLVKQVSVIHPPDGNPVETVEEELAEFTFDNAGQGEGYEYKRIAFDANDLVYDPATKKIYASSALQDSVVAIDPVTGTIGPSLTVGSRPYKLAISDNGQFLYVGLNGEGAVRRVHIPTFTLDIKFSLGTNSFGQSLNAEDIEVIPGSPQSIAVARVSGDFHEGVAIFDNAIQRPVTTPSSFTGSNVIDFGQSPSVLYGHNRVVNSGNLFTMSLNASGVTIVNTASFETQVFGRINLEFDAGRIYLNTGKVILPSPPTLAGMFQGLPPAFGTTETFGLVRPDNGRTFFLPYPGDTQMLFAYDQSSLQLIGSQKLPFASVLDEDRTAPFVRWGSNGLAFRTIGGWVMFVKTALVP
jgi:DNA-binding beta-propeller fold protein YncE